MVTKLEFSLLLLVLGLVPLGSAGALNTTLAANSSPYSKYLTVSNKEQAYVSAGSLVSFSYRLLAQEKADSLLYAELVASDVYDRTEDFAKWYGVYIDTLKEIGWIISTLGFTPYYPPSDSHFTILDVVWDILAPNCKTVQKEILKKLLDVWKVLKDYDQQVRCFLASSGTGAGETNAANFQIMPATRDSTGEIFVVFGGFYYESHIAVLRYMTYYWTAQAVSLHHSVELARFRSSRYTLFRKTIQSTLGNRAEQLIFEIHL